jgi:RNA polymerase sigma factor (sigma-70 family)
MDTIEDVELARSGDKDAFVRLIRCTEASLYQASRAILGSDEDCADAIQETILRAFRSIHGLREPSYFKTWIIRILINECKRLLNARKNIVPLQKAQEASTSEQAYSRLELREEIDKLDVDLRTIIHLYYYCDLSIKHIAEVLELPEGTVKSRLHRAREILFRQMNEPMIGVDYS